MKNEIAEILQSVCEEMCDNYCKYQHAPVSDGKTKDWLYEDDDSLCVKCPLNRIN